MSSDNNNNNNPMGGISRSEDYQEVTRSSYRNIFVLEPSFFNQTVNFSLEEEPSQTINRFLQSVSNVEIVDNLLNGIMEREQIMEDRMMEIATRESLDQYKTQEKKPDVELCVEGEIATKDHLDKSCVICKSDFELNEKITVLECKHILHTECISEWVKYKSECPTCRAKIHTTFTEQEEKY